MHINWFLSILAITEERGKPLTDAEASYLSEKLPWLTHPNSYKEAKKQIQNLLAEQNKYK